MLVPPVIEMTEGRGGMHTYPFVFEGPACERNCDARSGPTARLRHSILEVRRKRGMGVLLARGGIRPPSRMPTPRGVGATIFFGILSLPFRGGPGVGLSEQALGAPPLRSAMTYAHTEVT